MKKFVLYKKGEEAQHTYSPTTELEEVVEEAIRIYNLTEDQAQELLDTESSGGIEIDKVPEHLIGG